MAHIAALWRYPIKSHGREAIDTVTLTPGTTLPWDRHWAVTHGRSKFDADTAAWVACRNFMIGVTTPALAGLSAQFDEGAHRITLTHPDLEIITFDPDDATDAARFLTWLAPLCPEEKRQPTALVRAADRGFTDTPAPTIAIMNTASHAAVATHMGRDLESARWRGNIWVDNLPAWAEFDWVGKSFRMGDAELEVIEPIKRCMHTAASPVTGQRDADTLGALQTGFGHQNFGVYAIVKTGGRIARNTSISVI